MKFFYISTIKNENASYEVHHRECPFLPEAEKREYIGAFNTGKEALRKIIHANPNASLCKICCTGELNKRVTKDKDHK
ncbi:hypothetical protein [Arthrospiribacter ruber]|uniref:Uncharacterized protein n=1 Tax=Arthrospiribacter ruber TaxID=2487934 RepID=A0A951J1M8_9BACT|nr:hypothetical protein [Arthrospiribacter ruber]MBW3469373.1 hypothetical protein [Arthrospiribacter ruber]